MFVLVAMGCGGPDDPSDGDGGGADSGATDAGSGDGGPMTDAGATCDETLGLACTDSCPTAFECVEGRCVPARAECGGFAGATCSDPTQCCSYPSGSSSGICVSPQESACLDTRAPGAFASCTLSP